MKKLHNEDLYKINGGTGTEVKTDKPMDKKDETTTTKVEVK